MNEAAALAALKASPDLAALFENLLERLDTVEAELAKARGTKPPAASLTQAMLDAAAADQPGYALLDGETVIKGLDEAHAIRKDAEDRAKLTPQERQDAAADRLRKLRERS